MRSWFIRRFTRDLNGTTGFTKSLKFGTIIPSMLALILFSVYYSFTPLIITLLLVYIALCVIDFLQWATDCATLHGKSIDLFVNMILDKHHPISRKRKEQDLWDIHGLYWLARDNGMMDQFNRAADIICKNYDMIHRRDFNRFDEDGSLGKALKEEADREYNDFKGQLSLVISPVSHHLDNFEERLHEKVATTEVHAESTSKRG